MKIKTFFLLFMLTFSCVFGAARAPFSYSPDKVFRWYIRWLCHGARWQRLTCLYEEEPEYLRLVHETNFSIPKLYQKEEQKKAWGDFYEPSMMSNKLKDDVAVHHMRVALIKGLSSEVKNKLVEMKQLQEQRFHKERSALVNNGGALILGLLFLETLQKKSLLRRYASQIWNKIEPFYGRIKHFLSGLGSIKRMEEEK